MNNKNLMSVLKDPETCARSLWERVPGYIRLTFCAAAVLGLVTHLYMFTNKFTNHDDMDSLFGNTYGAASGRWLRPLFIRLGGSASMPWLVGLLSVLCLAAAACLTVSLLRIRRPVGCVLAAGILVSFPTVLATFTYMYTSFAYFLSLLLAVFGAWAAVRWGWRGSAAAAAAIALSLSVYQSYLPAAAALMVGALLLEALDGEKTFKALFLRGLRLLGTLIAGLAVYMVLVRVTTGGNLTSYMGLDNMGRISLKELPGQIWRAYQNYFLFFWEDQSGCHFEVLKYALPLAAAGTAALVGAVLRHRRLGWARTVLAAGLLAIFPLAADLIFLMVPDAQVHTLMIYGMSYALILPIAIAEYAAPVLTEGFLPAFRGAVSWIVALTMALTTYSYIVASNKCYLKIDLSMRQCEAYSVRLLERIETCEGYEPWMGVVLVGSDLMEGALFPMTEMGDVQVIGAMSFAGLRSSYTYGYYLRNFLGFNRNVFVGGSEEEKAAAALDEVKEMPLYPREGSVRALNGMVVVKLN